MEGATGACTANEGDLRADGVRERATRTANPGETTRALCTALIEIVNLILSNRIDVALDTCMLLNMFAARINEQIIEAAEHDRKAPYRTQKFWRRVTPYQPVALHRTERKPSLADYAKAPACESDRII